jgi:HTH-type transcriptional regulator/antitoxin HipB
MINYPIQLSTQLSQHLRSFRQLRKMTQQQLAQSLGLTQSRIAEIEANPGKVSVENLLKILSALNVQFVLADKQDQSALGVAKLIDNPPNQANNTLSQVVGLEMLHASKRKTPRSSW